MHTRNNHGVGESRMRISAAARAAGVTRQTIEYYIMIGLIQPLRPPGRNARFFDAALVKRIKLIRRLNQSGYTLRDIRDVYFKRK
ncbi:MAG: MerR family transcriptional regulator [Phycisphaerae bacterium]|nr:MerR family transcriptional regulator [Phycisphaerae bacterium]